ncbi:MAG: hypothetical protein IKL33_03500, partial [Alphaproteobacteria bacterium]|nr:hypothetical protein [Alphaproteobacteria bacterium]
SIKIDKNNNLSMGASNSDGENIIPDQKRFNDIADLALQNNQIINFGNIKTPEFKARLLLATMQKGLKTQNAPELTTEFLNSIDKQTRQSLETETYKQRQKELTNGFSVEDTPFKALEETYPDLAKASKFKFKQKDPNKNEVAINATDKNGNYVFSFVINKDTEEYTFQGKLNGKEQSFSSNGLNGMQPLPESVLKAIKNFNGNVMHGHRKIQMQQNTR